MNQLDRAERVPFAAVVVIMVATVAAIAVVFTSVGDLGLPTCDVSSEALADWHYMQGRANARATVISLAIGSLGLLLAGLASYAWLSVNGRPDREQLVELVRRCVRDAQAWEREKRDEIERLKCEINEAEIEQRVELEGLGEAPSSGTKSLNFVVETQLIRAEFEGRRADLRKRVHRRHEELSRGPDDVAIGRWIGQTRFSNGSLVRFAASAVCMLAIVALLVLTLPLAREASRLTFDAQPPRVHVTVQKHCPADVRGRDAVPSR